MPDSEEPPDLVLEILGQPDRYTKGNQFYREVRSALGNGMLTSEGDVWHRQRRFLAPVFTPKRISTAYASVMPQEAQRLVERWERPAAAGVCMVGAFDLPFGHLAFDHSGGGSGSARREKPGDDSPEEGQPGTGAVRGKNRPSGRWWLG